MDSLIVKKEHILEMLDGLGFYQMSRFSVETQGRVLKLISNESSTKVILEIPLQEDYTFDVDLAICNIIVNIAKNYFKDDLQAKSIQCQRDKIDLVVAILEDLSFYVYNLDKDFCKESLSNNICLASLFHSADIRLELSSSEIAVVPTGMGISPCRIYLSDQFSYSVLSDICRFILMMAQRMKEDYAYLNRVSQWV